MNVQRIITGVLIDDDATLTFVDVCQKYDLTEPWLRDLLEQGIFSHIDTAVIPMKQLNFDPLMVKRVLSARRLEQDLGINVPGVLLALELLDELDAIRDELDVLKRHLTDMPLNRP